MATDDRPDTAGITPAADLVAFLNGLGQRHPVIRTGQRAPIPWPVRLAVLIRDGNTCSRCGTYVRKGSELDHIHPWSAGGEHDTTNLRTLCRTCNQDRSNYAEGDERPRQPATWWCQACDPGEETWPIYFGIPVLDRWRASCTPDEYDAAYQAIRRLREPELAFCARCDSSGYARWVL